MIATLVQLLIVLVIIGVVFWGLNRVLAVMPIAEPFKTIIYVIVVVIAVIVVISILASLFGFSWWPVHAP